MAAQRRTGRRRAYCGALAATGLAAFLSCLVAGCSGNGTPTMPTLEPMRSLALALTPDGSLLVSCDVDNKISVTETASGKERAKFEGGESPAICLAVAPDGRLAATGHGMEREVILWDLEAKKEDKTFGGFPGGVNALVFSRDGKSLVGAVGFLSAPGGFLRMIDVSKKEAGEIQREKDSTVSLAFSPDSKKLVYGTRSSAVVLDVASNKEESRIPATDNQTVSCVCFSPDGKLVALGDTEGTLFVYDMGAKKVAATLKGHNLPVRSVAFSPDGKLLATGSEDKTVRLWDVAAGKETHKLEGHRRLVKAVAFSPDGKVLYSASDDKVIKSWDPATGQEAKK